MTIPQADEMGIELKVEALFFDGSTNKTSLSQNEYIAPDSADLSMLAVWGINQSKRYPDRLTIDQYRTPGEQGGKKIPLKPEDVITGIIASDFEPKTNRQGTFVMMYCPGPNGSVRRITVPMEMAADLLLKAAKIADLPAESILDKMASRIAVSGGVEKGHERDALVEVQKVARAKLLTS